jgi:hypothetical protein
LIGENVNEHEGFPAVISTGRRRFNMQGIGPSSVGVEANAGTDLRTAAACVRKREHSQAQGCAGNGAVPIKSSK